MRAVLALILAGSSVVPAKVATAACSFGAPPPCPSLDARRGAADPSSPAGLWAPIDGKTGQRLGLIRIFQKGGLFFGRIEPSSPSDDRSARCTLCTDERRNQPIIGLVILRHLRLEEGEYVGGDILDPDTGHLYGCKFRLIEGGRKAIMRGFLGISLLGRSQTCERVE
jgi:uncharacterized protein (DUF2147 family)